MRYLVAAICLGACAHGEMAVPDGHASSDVDAHPGGGGGHTTDAPQGGGNPDGTTQVTGHLVINEVDYDNVGTDSKEFVELYNPTSSDLTLSGVALVLVNGGNSTAYANLDLSPLTSVPSHAYAVISGAGVTVPASAMQGDAGWTQDAIQNGAPDGVALLDMTSQTVIDALAYEGPITSAQMTGFAAPISLVEGTGLATGVADSNTVSGSLCRMPDGQDTDDANVDWTFCTTPTPGDTNQ